MAETNPNPARPDSGGNAHGVEGIPLPDHGFERLDANVRELASVPARDTIRQVAVLLMSAGAEKLGLTPGEEPDIDLDEARSIIDALAGLLAGAQDHLGDQRQALRDGLRTLQKAFREASVHPDEPGDGPGESLLH